MSYSPWPLVLVGLGSLGFLANSMAQQQNQFDQRFDDELLGFDEVVGNGGYDNSDELAPLIPRQFQQDVAAALDELDEQPESSQTPERLSARTGGGPHRLRLRSSNEPERETTRVAQLQNRFRDKEPNTSILRRDEEPQTRPGLSTNIRRPFSTTKETSLFETPNYRSGASFGDERNTFRPTGDAGPANTPLAAANDQDDANSGESTQTKVATRVPLWGTLLFLSIAGNLFFCWQAWSTHTKYLDLVEDFTESEQRSERQRRRLRSDSSQRRSSRQRDADEAEYLSAAEAQI